MSDPQNLDPQQSAAVDQSSQTRDPADDSGLLDDPAAIADTYPGAFDGSEAEAEVAIEAERRSEHSSLDPDRSTDNARDRQI